MDSHGLVSTPAKILVTPLFQFHCMDSWHLSCYFCYLFQHSFNSIVWIRTIVQIGRLAFSPDSLSIPLYGFMEGLVKQAKPGELKISFNSIVWIRTAVPLCGCAEVAECSFNSIVWIPAPACCWAVQAWSLSIPLYGFAGC